VSTIVGDLAGHGFLVDRGWRHGRLRHSWRQGQLCVCDHHNGMVCGYSSIGGANFLPSTLMCSCCRLPTTRVGTKRGTNAPSKALPISTIPATLSVHERRGRQKKLAPHKN